MNHVRHTPPLRIAGYTLVELMVSMLIGAMIIGAVMSAVLGTGLTGRRQDAQSQLAEEGKIALHLLASQLRMAGYFMPDSPIPALEPPLPVLFGCLHGFSTISAAFASLGCSGSSGSDSIALRYRPDNLSSGASTDCLGNALAAGTEWVDNRYYIADSNGAPSLMCRGNGGSGHLNGQALISNVESLQLRYGVAAVRPLPAPGRPIIFDQPAYSGDIVRFLRADALTNACSADAPADDSWCAVTSIRACLILRAADTNSADADFSYIDCDGARVTPTDGRVRRAVTTTVTLRNRAGVAP